jgi:hypothetical protein
MTFVVVNSTIIRDEPHGIISGDKFGMFVHEICVICEDWDEEYEWVTVPLICPHSVGIVAECSYIVIVNAGRAVTALL